MLGLLGTTLAQIHCTAQVRDQTDLQVMGNGAATGPPAVNLVTTPSIDFSAASSGWTLALSEAVTLTGRALASGPTADALEQGSLRLVYGGRRFHATIDERASYGTITYATIPLATPGMPPPALQALPLNTTLFTAGSRSTLELAERFTRRFEGAAYGGFSMSGGADATARSILPFQSGPIAGLRATYALSRVDSLEGHADYTRADFTATACSPLPTPASVAPMMCEPKDDQITGTLGFRRRLSREDDLSVQGGASAVGQRLSETMPYTFHLFPAAGATLTLRTRHEGQETTGHFGAQLLTVLSQLTGAADLRLQGDVGVDWTSRRLLLHGLVRASDSIPPNVAAAYLDVSGEGSVGLRFQPYVTVMIGGQADWLRYATATGLSGAAGLGFIRLQVASRVFHF
jgi:hypothetical protein